MSGNTVRIDDLPIGRFHIKIAGLTFGAHFTDGYILGLIGIAFTLINPQLNLDPFWQGLIGSSALLGYLGEAGVDRFHIAHVLNHRSVTHSTVTAIYDRYRYDKEKRAALEKWASVLAAVAGLDPKAATMGVHLSKRSESTPVQTEATMTSQTLAQ